LTKDNYIETFAAAFGKLFQWSDFYSPQWFWALLIVPVLIIIYLIKEKNDVIELHYSSSKGFGNTTPLAFLRHIPFALTILSITFFILALARPQDAKSWEETKTEGIDMVITLDVSQSMEAKDFKPNRLEASKKIASEFINTRKNDRFGLVIFGDESFTQCPLTIDHKRIIELFKDVQIGMVGGSTAIGSGIATSVKRLKDSESKSKVIILLTDGVNTNNEITPRTAAEIAKTFDIKLYIIGIGKRKFTEVIKDRYGRKRKVEKETKIDIKKMTEISELTGGKFFRATNQEALKNIYEEIDKLEKTELASLKYYKKTELFLPFALIGLLLLALSKALNITIFKTIE
jgi:Ca-activated chloride channel family protein